MATPLAPFKCVDMLFASLRGKQLYLCQRCFSMDAQEEPLYTSKSPSRESDLLHSLLSRSLSLVQSGSILSSIREHIAA